MHPHPVRGHRATPSRRTARSSSRPRDSTPRRRVSPGTAAWSSRDLARQCRMSGTDRAAIAPAPRPLCRPAPGHSHRDDDQNAHQRGPIRRPLDSQQALDPAAQPFHGGPEDQESEARRHEPRQSPGCTLPPPVPPASARQLAACYSAVITVLCARWRAATAGRTRPASAARPGQDGGRPGARAARPRVSGRGSWVAEQVPGSGGSAAPAAEARSGPSRPAPGKSTSSNGRARAVVALGRGRRAVVAAPASSQGSADRGRSSLPRVRRSRCAGGPACRGPAAFVGG